MNDGKSSIKAVTFDLWETLLLEKDGWNLRRTNARCYNLAQEMEKLGLKISVGQLAFAFKEMASWLASIWQNNEEVTHLDQVRFIIETASKGSIRIKDEWMSQLSSAYVSALFEVPPYLNPDAPKVLAWLRDTAKLSGLICNTGLTPGFGLRSFLAGENLADYFDLMLFSDEVGFRKPDPRIFQMAAQRLQVKPHRIVHVGDNLNSDVWGAKNVGYRAIYFCTEAGRDGTAESDPTSLVSISRKPGTLAKKQTIPDKTVTSLAMTIEAIKELET